MCCLLLVGFVIEVIEVCLVFGVELIYEEFMVVWLEYYFCLFEGGVWLMLQGQGFELVVGDLISFCVLGCSVFVNFGIEFVCYLFVMMVFSL